MNKSDIILFISIAQNNDDVESNVEGSRASAVRDPKSQ